MGKRIVTVFGSIVVLGAAFSVLGCGAAPEETGEPEEVAEENVGTSSEALPCTNCDEGGGTYEPPEYYPYDDECGTGETRWNSGAGCSPYSRCKVGLTGCGLIQSIRRCDPIKGCGPAPSPSTNPCYGGSVGQYCTLSGGYPGHCDWDWNFQLACFP